jgi:vancomycin resistance protein YoaR
VVHPAVETAALLPALARGQWLLRHPPALVAGKVRWTPAPGALAPALQLGDGAQPLTLAPSALRHIAAWLARSTARPASDARWEVDGQHARLVPATIGAILDEQALARRLLAAAPGTAEVAVPFRPLAPPLTTARAQSMHIRTLVGTSYTNFYGSTENRITNILAAVQALDGKLIAPGEVFSFNKEVGPIDYAHGYVDGISIIDGQDVPGVGGGVCQVAVTIFKGAIYSGLPIVERHPHANVVPYYQPVGMDATIYQSPDGPDVKFKNDTGQWLLMRFAYNLNTAYLEVRFYGAGLNQQVEIDGPYYTYPGNGDTTAIFYRKVYRNGKKVRDESFFSEYVPVKS